MEKINTKKEYAEMLACAEYLLNTESGEKLHESLYLYATVFIGLIRSGYLHKKIMDEHGKTIISLTLDNKEYICDNAILKTLLKMDYKSIINPYENKVNDIGQFLEISDINIEETITDEVMQAKLKEAIQKANDAKAEAKAAKKELEELKEMPNDNYYDGKIPAMIEQVENMTRENIIKVLFTFIAVAVSIVALMFII